MSETALWNSSRKKLKLINEERSKNFSPMQWQRFEDKLANGVPDVYLYCDRHLWVELKQVDEWPARATTKVRAGLRSDQALWLTNHKKAGGNAFVFVKIKRDLFLFNDYFDELVEGMIKEEFNSSARERFSVIQDVWEWLIWMPENDIRRRKDEHTD